MLDEIYYLVKFANFSHENLIRMPIYERRYYLAKLIQEFEKKKEFTRFIKSKISINKKGIIEVEVLKGQESFRIKSLIKSNNWAIFKSGKENFKKGELIDCFKPLVIQ